MGFLTGLTALTSAIAPMAAEGEDLARQSLANRSPIHIAPVGFNFGAIVAPFNEGAPTNGGYGVDIPSRYRTVATEAQPTLATRPGLDWRILLLAGGAGLGLLLIMRR